MKYTFDYEETLQRRVEVYADNLGEAILKIRNQVDNQELVLGGDDWIGSKLSIPAEVNPMVRVTDEGKEIEDVSCMDIEIDWW